VSADNGAAAELGECEVGVPVTGLWSSAAAPRPLDAALTERRPRLTDWLAAQGPTERRQLWGLLDSQLLLGERVVVHEIDDEWARVTAPMQPSSRDATGYRGFVPAHHLRAAVTTTPDAPAVRRVVVHAPVSAVRDAPDGEILLASISFGTVLPVTERAADWVGVRLPGGGTGWLPGSDVDDVRSPDSAPPTADELVDAGRQFLGVTYIAAGLHGLGFDCSGLVHAVYRRFGITVPRDARDQVAVGEAVPLAEMAYGDLMFFTNPDTGDVDHVGFALDDGAMLHASQADWAIIDTVLTERRRAHLAHVRRLRSDS
jgi:cell wall-associated NlpC family hydrolase